MEDIVSCPSWRRVTSFLLLSFLLLDLSHLHLWLYHHHTTSLTAGVIQPAFAIRSCNHSFPRATWIRFRATSNLYLLRGTTHTNETLEDASWSHSEANISYSLSFRNETLCKCIGFGRLQRSMPCAISTTKCNVYTYFQSTASAKIISSHPSLIF